MIGGRLRGVALAVGVAAIWCVGCRRDPNDAARRTEHEAAIAAVVLQDLMQLEPDAHDPQFRPSVFCVFVGESRQGYSDPPKGLLGRLGGAGVRVVAASECRFPAYRLKVSDTRVALIGVSSVEWRRDDQVKVKAERGIGPLAGRGWDYTLSLTAKGWEIDNATPTWIS